MIRQINVRTISDRRYLHNVDASTTPVQCFELAALDYDGATAIIVAGHPINATQAYGPISDIIHSEDYDGVITVSAIAKHDNALEVRTIGNSVYIISSATPEQIDDMNEWTPQAMMLEEDCIPFCVENGCGEGVINEFGVRFAENDIDGKAFVHMSIPDDMTMEEFKKNFTKLDIAHQLWKMKQIEDGYELNLRNVEIRKNAVLDCFAE